MPSDTATAIARAYRQMKGLPVAVRSSATAEDLAEASFAGQQSTFLNIQGEENVHARRAGVLGLAVRGAGHLLPRRGRLRPPEGRASPSSCSTWCSRSAPA